MCPSYPTPNFVVLHFWWWWNSVSHLVRSPPPPYCATANSLPILSPLVWSAVGPVCALTVLPLFMVQSKSSPCWVLVHVHNPDSKSQEPAMTSFTPHITLQTSHHLDQSWPLTTLDRLQIPSTCNDKFHMTRHCPDKSSLWPVLTTDHTGQTTNPKYLQ